MQGAQSMNVGEVLLLTGLLIAAVIVGGLIVMWLRRRMTTDTRGGHDATVLDSLRAMRDSGAISIEEYEAARLGLIERVRGQTLGANKPGSLPDKNADGVRNVATRGPNLPTPRAEGLVARPGYDLTGAPLPRPADERSPKTGENRGSSR